MPIIKSAIKKMRKDRARTKHNSVIKTNLKTLVKKARRTPNSKTYQELQKVLDKAVKTKLIHANKAARLKSRLAKGTGSTTPAATKSGQKSSKKGAAKKSSKKS